MPEPAGELDGEDEKLVVLARSARARTGTAEGAAVRDQDGRTYAACDVRLVSFSVTAMQAAVVAAVSSGAAELEAAALVTEANEVTPTDLDAAGELGAGAPVYRADPSGTVHEVVQ